MPTPLPPITDLALASVSDFLATFLGGDVPLQAERTDALPDLSERTVLVANDEDGAPRFAVALDAGWGGVLSQAMLGEALAGDEADDLLQEIAGQAYGAFRTAAGASGPTPPSVLFSMATDDTNLPDDLATVTFAWARDGEPLGGAVLLSAPLLDAPIAEVPPAKAPTEHDMTTTPPAPATPSEPVEVARAEFNDFGGEQFVGGDGANGNLHVLSDVELEVTVELGRRRLPLADVLRLTTGSVIELEKLVGQPLEVYANGRLIAEGEAVVIDEQFGVRVTSLTSQKKARRAFL